jgi:hypothetical protein
MEYLVLLVISTFWFVTIAKLKFALNEVNYWKKKYDIEHNLNKHWSKYAGNRITKYIKNYFNGTKVSNYLIQVNGGNFSIQIGNDERLISVETKKFIKTPELALEEAYLIFREQQKAKGEKNG